MNTRKFTAKANRKSIDILENQLIEVNIEFFTAIKYLKASVYAISSQDQKYIETLQKKIQITNSTLQRKIDNKQRHQNPPNANSQSMFLCEADSCHHLFTNIKRKNLVQILLTHQNKYQVMPSCCYL